VNERGLVDLARVALDIAIGSMDFGSGFLDNEEVEALRELAVLLGVDPWQATPPNMRDHFCGDHPWGEWEINPNALHRRSWRRTCTRCGKREFHNEQSPPEDVAKKVAKL